MSFTFIELLSIFSVFLFVSFSGYLLSIPSKKKLSNQLFACYLLIIALDISAFFYHKFIQLPLALEMIRIEGLAGLKSPMLYLYILSVLYDDFSLKKKHLLFFIPLLINFIVLIPAFFNQSSSVQNEFFQQYTSQPAAIFITFFGYLVGFSFLFVEIYQVRRYGLIVKQHYANAAALNNYHWLKQFLIVDVIISVITFVKSYYRFTSESATTVDSWRIVTLILIVLFISWLFSKALFAPKLFQGINAALTPMEDNHSTPTDERIQTLNTYLKTEKPYLNASLTIQQLSDAMDIPVRELSGIINQETGKHFFDYINEFRINDAKELLTSDQDLTVLEILYDVGFNSKSSFYTAFKKETNQTPTSYRKSTT
ncbi:Transcriptional regulator, AraC family [Tenacibaculum litopenaei]|uniref:helix-turn-helix domain-containing protein n=1 Tax=Tenacibaculum litopenaei TaxID=396016 RepID=UPI0038938CF0